MGSLKSIAVGDVRVNLIEKHDRICMSINEGRAFERETRRAFGRLVRERDGIVIDVGAYTGLYGIAATLMGKPSVMFEPMPQNFARIGQNLLANGLTYLHCLPIRKAVADYVGPCRINFRRDVVGLTSGASIFRKSADAVEVLCTTLDDEIADTQAVALIKIDVERAENLVLAGAQKMLARWRPPIIMEALTENLQRKSEALLPGYKLSAVLDVRNRLYEPA